MEDARRNCNMLRDKINIRCWPKYQYNLFNCNQWGGGGHGVPGGKDRVREKETHCHLVLNQLRSSHSLCHAMALDIFGGRLDAPQPPGRRWLLRSRAAGSESPVSCSSPTWRTAAGSGLLANGADFSAPSLMAATPPRFRSTTASLTSHLFFIDQQHRLGQPLAVSATSCCPISSAPRSPSAARALWQHVPPSHLQHFSHYHFICCSLVNSDNIWQELRVKMCQNKFTLIMSNNFDRKVLCITINQNSRKLLVWQYLHNYQYFIE